MNNLSKEMVDRIHRMANATWEAIGGEVLTIMEEQGEGNVLSRDEVVDCVCDASYMMYHGGDKEAYEAWSKLERDAQDQIIREAFPSSRYGW